MTIKPTSINPSTQTNNSDTLATLLKQLPMGKILQAQLLTLQQNSLLVIDQFKPVKIELPLLTLPQTKNQVPKNAVPVQIIVQIIEKSPILKLQLELINNGKENKTPQQQTAETYSKPISTASSTTLVHNPLKLPNALFEIIIENKLPIKIQPMETPVILNKIENTITTQPLQQNIVSSKLQTSTLDKVLWPQHATLEKLSQSLIISKLSQLNNALPAQGKDPFVDVLQKWIKQLISSATENKVLNTTKPSTEGTLDSQAVRRAIANNGSLWESNLRKETGLSRSRIDGIASPALPVLNIKAQILRIIQSLPVVLTRIDPEIAGKFISSETEIWQIVFKIRQHLDLQNQGSIPLPSTQLQPEFWMNWLEQNLKLITLWLRNVEQQQAELPQQNNQQTLLRFELPMPTDTGSQWLKIDIEEQDKQARKKNNWKWQLKMSFDFGEEKKLFITTKINSKDLSVLFEGGDYFENKMGQDTLDSLASKLEQKTGLSSLISFNNIQQANAPKNTNKNSATLHLEI